MTDLHTHILPGMDDGPKDVPAALALLEQQWQQGVRNVALTSHYHCELETPDAFLARREQAFSALCGAAPRGMTLKRGCEVFFSPELLRIDPAKLCLEGTRYLLLELPILQRPAFLSEVLLGLTARGIVPLIAHAERYLYVQRDPRVLMEWIDLGARIQVNAGSDCSFIRKLLRWGLVHVMASDAHHVTHRPADLSTGLKKLDAQDAARLSKNAELIFSGQHVPAGEVRTPKKVLGFWL